MNSLPFRNPDLLMEERIDDLVSRLTLAEKMALIQHNAPAVPRLGIPPFTYSSDDLHGVSRNGRATVFPQVIGLAATWNTTLIKQIASAIGDEARAKHHAAARLNDPTIRPEALTTWAPNVNIYRDPRWGRGQETWGEDPCLTGEMSAAFVGGLQGDHPIYLKVAASVKHFAVHSGPEAVRHTMNLHPSARDLRDTYLPVFKKLVQEARVEGVMAAYNLLYDQPCCANDWLLHTLLRQEWGFNGHVVSDCGGITDFHTRQKITSDAAESVALALKNHCDLPCDSAADAIPEAFKRGMLDEIDINRALSRILRARFRVGEFDPPAKVPYASIPLSVVGSRKHRALAYKAAAQSIVLLKNRHNFLPLSDKTRSILIVGPTAASVDVLLGNYYGFNEHMTTLVEGIGASAPLGVRVDYRPGAILHAARVNPNEWSETLAAEVDVVIACMGLAPQMEGEEGDAILSPANGDRTDLRLPANQVAYLKSLAASGTPIVLVLSGGSPLILSEVEDLVDAILYLWYPGQEGGKAAADALFGRLNPSGRLPITFPASMNDLPPFDDYSMTGRTYRYSLAEPAFPFGFGLSYTRFSYFQPQPAPIQVASGDAFCFQVQVKNTGERDGREIVQVYLQDELASAPVPHWKLVAFRSVALKAGQGKTLRFQILPEAMQFINEKGEPQLEPGAFRLHIGGCSPSNKVQGYEDGALAIHFILVV